jgi:cbb3-type cytochrome oxidase maturation protein
MESLYLLIPLALLILVIIVAILFWAIGNGQFDDLEGPAHSILMDDDTDRNFQQEPVSKKVDIGQNSSVEHRVISDSDKSTNS